MNKYTHLQVADVAGALDRLPEVQTRNQQEVVRATGTDDSLATSLPQACQNSYTTRQERAQRGTESPQEENEEETTQPVKAERLGTQGHAKSRRDTSRPGRIRTTDQGIMSPLL